MLYLKDIDCWKVTSYFMSISFLLKVTTFWLSTCRIGTAITGMLATVISWSPLIHTFSFPLGVFKVMFRMISHTTMVCTLPLTINPTLSIVHWTRRRDGGTITVPLPCLLDSIIMGDPTRPLADSTMGCTGRTGRATDILSSFYPWLFLILKAVIWWTWGNTSHEKQYERGKKILF